MFLRCARPTRWRCALHANVDAGRRQQLADRCRGLCAARRALQRAPRERLRLRFCFRRRNSQGIRRGWPRTTPCRAPNDAALAPRRRGADGPADNAWCGTRHVDLRAPIGRDAPRGSPRSKCCRGSTAARRESAVTSGGKWRNGRRSRLKSGRGNSCGFDSHLPHHLAGRIPS